VSAPGNTETTRCLQRASCRRTQLRCKILQTDSLGILGSAAALMHTNEAQVQLCSVSVHEWHSKDSLEILAEANSTQAAHTYLSNAR